MSGDPQLVYSLEIKVLDLEAKVASLEKNLDRLAREVSATDSVNIPADVLDLIGQGEHPVRAVRQYRLLTQKELGELLGTHKLHIAGQESSRRSIQKATINHLALIYAVNSLPPDAPVSIIQEMLVPPGLIRKRQKAMQRLKTKPQKRR